MNTNKYTAIRIVVTNRYYKISMKNLHINLEKYSY